MLIRALPAIVAGAPGARLVVAGHPFEPVEPLQALAAELGVADAIDWRLGYVPDADVPALFASSTVVVCPYRELDSSGVLATALGHGRPAVVSDVGSLGTIVREFEAGRVVAPEDPGALAAACVELLTSADALANAAAGARKARATLDLGRSRRRARAALRDRPRGARMKRRPVQAAVKRVLDPVLSALLLVLLSPVFLVVTLVVLIGSGRPIFFVRPRAGRDGKPFSDDQVPHDGPRRDRARPRAQPERGPVRPGRERPAHDPRRPVPAPHRAGRDPAARERPPRADEHRRPAPRPRRAGRALHRGGAQAPRGSARGSPAGRRSTAART